MNKWIVGMLLYTVISTGYAVDKFYDADNYYYEALQKVEREYAITEKSIDDKLNFVCLTINILLDYQMTADTRSFYKTLKATRPSIDLVSSLSRDLYHCVYNDCIVNREPYTYKRIPTYIYHNNYHQETVLTKEERDFFYNDEIKLTENVKMLPKILLNKKSLKSLIPGIPYNFVLTLKNELWISYEQLYNLKMPELGKLINTPNHTILAGNGPVLSAGNLIVQRVENKELYFISSTSGHFHPSPDSLVHMKKELISLGVPEEAIISLGLTYKKMIRKVEKSKQKQIML